MVKNYIAKHLDRLGTTNASPVMSLIYTDLLNCYRRIKDHSINVAEALIDFNKTITPKV